MYKSLFIDLDDTLWAFSENMEDTLRELYVSYHFDRYFNSFDHFFLLYKAKNEELWAEYAEGKIRKDELNTLRFSYPLEAVGVKDIKLVNQYSADFFSIIPLKSKLMPYAREAIEYLAGKYRLYILSNGFKQLQSTKMASAGILHYFEKIILSEDIQVMKPHPAIFNFALSSTQSLPKESLMIGDNWQADIEGAHRAGLAQMYYSNGTKNKLPFSPTFLLYSWKEIKTML